MPKRLSDITHAYERTTDDLEDAQDQLTQATESARVKVDAAAQARHKAYDDLFRWLKDHPDEVIVANDWGYRFERGQIARMKVQWAHHVWVEDPEPAPTYRVPSPVAAYHMPYVQEAAPAEPSYMASGIDPDPDDDWDNIGINGRPIVDPDTEPNGQPVEVE